MLIDRSKFLLLATTIAASACTVVTKHPNEDDEDDYRDAATSTDTDGTSTDTEASDPTDTDTESSDPSSGDAGEEPSTDDGGAPTDSGAPLSDAGPIGDAGAIPSGPTTDAATDDASTAPPGDGDAGPNVGVCVGDEGEVPSCDALPENDFESFQSGECEGASVIMKPGVAAHYVECILAQSVDELNDTTNTYACKLEAALAACPDVEAEATCDAFLSYCPDEDRDECLAHANGLSEAGRESFVSCAESSCWGIYSCLEGL